MENVHFFKFTFSIFSDQDHLDGKSVRGSEDRYRGKAAIHMVSAWASTSRLVLAQLKVEDKSNEITALPDLLHQLALGGCVVTIDAMG